MSLSMWSSSGEKEYTVNEPFTVEHFAFGTARAANVIVRESKEITTLRNGQKVHEERPVYVVVFDDTSYTEYSLPSIKSIRQAIVSYYLGH